MKVKLVVSQIVAGVLLSAGTTTSAVNMTVPEFTQAAAAAQALKCSDDSGNRLELQDLPHIVGRLILKDPTSGKVREHKIDIGTADKGLSFAILAASPALKGEFYFSDPLENLSSVKSVSFYAGHWGWGEQINLSLQCSP